MNLRLDSGKLAPLPLRREITSGDTPMHYITYDLITVISTHLSGESKYSCHDLLVYLDIIGYSCL